MKQEEYVKLQKAFLRYFVGRIFGSQKKRPKVDLVSDLTFLKASSDWFDYKLIQSMRQASSEGAVAYRWNEDHWENIP